jgi:hypothetical protein
MPPVEQTKAKRASSSLRAFERTYPGFILFALRALAAISSSTSRAMSFIPGGCPTHQATMVILLTTGTDAFCGRSAKPITTTRQTTTQRQRAAALLGSAASGSRSEDHAEVAERQQADLRGRLRSSVRGNWEFLDPYFGEGANGTKQSRVSRPSILKDAQKELGITAK